MVKTRSQLQRDSKRANGPRSQKRRAGDDTQASAPKKQRRRTTKASKQGRLRSEDATRSSEDEVEAARREDAAAPPSPPRMMDNYFQSMALGAKEFILYIFRQSKDTCRVDSTGLWNKLSFEWQCDSDVALAGLTHNFVKACDLPEVLRYDEDFLMTAIAENSNVWCHLPLDCKSEVKFSKAIRCFKSRALAWGVLEQLPELCEDVDIWNTIIFKSKVDEWESLFVEKAGPNLRSNDKFMLKVCVAFIEVVKLIGDPLLQNRNFIKALLQKNPAALGELSHATQERHRDLVSACFPDIIEFFFEGVIILRMQRFLLENLSPVLRDNRRFMESWFLAGGLFSQALPSDWKNDKEMFLLIAAHGSREISKVSFFHASLDLKNDKEFMLQVVRHQPWLFLRAGPDLTSDYDLALEALGGPDADEEFVDFYVNREQSTRSAFLPKLVKTVDEKLDAHDNFVKTFLVAMKYEQANSSDCAIPLLDQGAETSLGLKKLVAEFLGVPTGKELKFLRRAQENLPLQEDIVYNIDDDDSDEESSCDCMNCRMRQW